jgi:hypothetical protein
VDLGGDMKKRFLLWTASKLIVLAQALARKAR